jgi:Family of unknown function (DUF6188)
MYGLPTDFDGKFLIGRRLEQICFNENQISLQFDAEVWVVIEGKYAYQDASLSANIATSSVPALRSDLMQLVAQAITRVEGTRDGTLSLIFTNGHVLKCFDDPHYEAYQVRDGARVIIV